MRGVEVVRAEIAKNGKIIIIIGEAVESSSDMELTPNDELGCWRKKKNAE